LRLKGWRILDRRVRTPAGEVDIIARRGALIAFVKA
jgi:putative endonuclease